MEDQIKKGTHFDTSSPSSGAHSPSRVGVFIIIIITKRMNKIFPDKC